MKGGGGGGGGEGEKVRGRTGKRAKSKMGGGGIEKEGKGKRGKRCRREGWCGCNIISQKMNMFSERHNWVWKKRRPQSSHGTTVTTSRQSWY